MFALRDEHMIGLQEASLEDFAFRSEEYLRSAYRAEAASLTAEALRALVRESIDRGEKYGLELEEHIVDLAAATLVLGRSCHGDVPDAARDVLSRPDWSPERKHLELGLLVEAARSRVTR